MTGSYRGSGEASYHPELLLGLAREMGVQKLGRVALDGTKIHMWTAPSLQGFLAVF